MDLTLKRQIGQMILAGFPSMHADDQARLLVREYAVGNFILFTRNLYVSRQIMELCTELTQLCRQGTGTDPLIAADQEGGNVSRIAHGAALIPGAMALSAGCNVMQVQSIGKICGTVLRTLGINVNLAPVLDVNLLAENPVIGNRSYGDDPERVAELGCAMMRGLQEGGVLPVIKHFPGHGCVLTDSHLDLPVNNASVETLERTELLPFSRAIEAGAPAIMSSHVRYPQLDPEYPATMSEPIIGELLRKKKGFGGLVVTDCLEMDAVRKNWGTAEAAVCAVQAGCDLLCISHSAEAVAAVSEALYDAVQNGTLPRERIEESAARVMAVKERLTHCEIPSADEKAARAAIGNIDFLLEERQASRRSITLVKDNGGIANLQNASSVLVLAPEWVPSTGVEDEKRDSISFAKLLAGLMRGDYVDYSMNPNAAQIAELTLRAQHYEAVVLGVYNARLRDSQKALLHALQPLGKRMTVVMLGSPYDAPLAGKAGACVAAYEYTALSAESAAWALRHAHFDGRLPVKL